MRKDLDPTSSLRTRPTKKTQSNRGKELTQEMVMRIVLLLSWTKKFHFRRQNKHNPSSRRNHQNNASNSGRNGYPKSDRQNTSPSMPYTRDGTTFIGKNVRNSFLGQSHGDNEGGGEVRNEDQRKKKPQLVSDRDQTRPKKIY